MEVMNFVEYSRRELLDSYKDKAKLKNMEIKICFIYENYHLFGLNPNFILEEVKVAPELSEHRFTLKGFFKGETLLSKGFQIDILIATEVEDSSELDDYDSSEYECDGTKYTLYFSRID